MRKQKNIKVLPLKKVIMLDSEDKYPPKEGIYLRVDDVGGGPFLVMKCVDLEPTDEYGADEITFELEDWDEIDEAVRNFIREIVQSA